MVFIKDFAGILCSSLGALALLFGDYVVCIEMLLPWSSYTPTAGVIINIIFFNILVGLTYWSHYKAITSDPGYVPIQKVDDDVLEQESESNEPFEKFGEFVTICKKCSFYKPLLAHHCGTCKRCVRRLDHHCPWINNCVGEYNQKFFLNYLFYITVLSIYAGIIILLRVTSCSAPDSNCDIRESVYQLFLTIILSFMAIIFGFFAIVMILDQLHGIRKGMGGIDRLKGGKYHSRNLIPPSTFQARLSHVFGGGEFKLMWLLPVDPKIHVPDWSLE